MRYLWSIVFSLCLCTGLKDSSKESGAGGKVGETKVMGRI